MPSSSELVEEYASSGEPLLVLSNTVFLVAAYVAYKNNYPFRAYLMILLAIASGLYHACDIPKESYMHVCVLEDNESLRQADWFLSILSSCSCILVLATYRSWYMDYAAQICSFITPAMFYVSGGITSIHTAAMCVSPCVLWVMFSWVWSGTTPSIDPAHAALIIMLSVIAGLLFISNVSSVYPVAHSSWHVIIGVIVSMLLWNVRTPHSKLGMLFTLQKPSSAYKKVDGPSRGLSRYPPQSVSMQVHPYNRQPLGPTRAPKRRGGISYNF